MRIFGRFAFVVAVILWIYHPNRVAREIPTAE
jgi:hypothetical protein